MTETSSNPMRDAIQSAISDNPVILFMKGTPEEPACGFSARTVQVLEALDQPFAAVNILPDPQIRQELSAVSGWPTIPQLFVGGELAPGDLRIGIQTFSLDELPTAWRAQQASPHVKCVILPGAAGAAPLAREKEVVQRDQNP